MFYGVGGKLMATQWSENDVSLDLNYPMSHSRHLVLMGRRMWLMAALMLRFPTTQHLGLSVVHMGLKPLPDQHLALEVLFIPSIVEEVHLLLENPLFESVAPPLVWRYHGVVRQRPSVQQAINELIWIPSDPLRLLLGIHMQGSVQRL